MAVLLARRGSLTVSGPGQACAHPGGAGRSALPAPHGPSCLSRLSWPGSPVSGPHERKESVPRGTGTLPVSARPHLLTPRWPEQASEGSTQGAGAPRECVVGGGGMIWSITLADLIFLVLR